MNSVSIKALLAIVWLGWCCAACGDEVVQGWTRFQDQPQQLPAGKKAPLTWAPQQGIAWQAPLAGYGQSSPVAWRNQVYVTSTSGANREQCHIAAFNLATGAKEWQYDLKAATEKESTNYVSKAAPTPAVDALGVICFFEGGNIVALTHDGKLRWERNLVNEFGPIESRHGLSASIEQTADLAFIWVERATDPYVLAVNKATGKDVWKERGLGATSWSSPRLVAVGPGQHLVLSAIGSVVGLDPATGNRLWSLDGITGNSTPTPFPVGDGKFLLGATQGRGEGGGSGKAAESNGLVEIRRLENGSFAADYVWRAKRTTSSFGSPVAYQGCAYFVNAAGVLFCLDLQSGEEVYNSRIGDSLWATPLAVDDRIYLPGKSGLTIVVASGRELKKLAENLAWPTEAEPASGEGARPPSGSTLYAAILVGDRLLLRRGDELICVHH